MTEGIDYPPRAWSRLQKWVWMLRKYEVEVTDRYLEKFVAHNPWTDADSIRAELLLQQNGKRKLPEEVAAASPVITQEEIEE